MILTPIQEEFLRNFFERQREIGKQSLETTKLLAKANIESILWAGLDSPPTIERMENIIEELKKEKARQEAEDVAALEDTKNNGDQV